MIEREVTSRLQNVTGWRYSVTGWDSGGRMFQ